MRRVDPLLLAIVIAGLGLRLIGIGWGLPNIDRYHSYHPDEALQVGATLRVDPLGGDFDPGFYNYGSLSFFLTRLAWEFSEGISPSSREPWALSARLHLVGRLWTVFFGTLTLLLVFDIGRRLIRNDRRLSRFTPPADASGASSEPPLPEGGVLRRATYSVLLTAAGRGPASETGVSYWRSELGARVAGLCAAGLLAMAPAHVAHSHYFTVDIGAAFWATAAVAAGLRLLEGPRIRDAILAGLCAGLAAATKYNTGLVLLAPLMALALSYRGRLAEQGPLPAEGAESACPPLGKRVPFGRGFLVPALACIGTCAVAFLAGCPGVALNTAAFLRDFLFEAQHVRTGHGLVFVRTLPAWIYHITTSLRFGLGLPLLAIVLLAIAQAAKRRSPADLVVAAWVIPYYLLIGSAQVKFLRYTLPLLPMLAAWAGVLCADWLLNTKRSRWRALATSALVGIGFWTLGAAVSYDLFFASPDPRDRAAGAIRSAVTPGATVALTTEPWFYTPPLVPWNGGPQTRIEFEAARESWPYQFLVGGWSAERVARERPECFIASNLEEQIRDGVRLGLPEAEQLVAILEREYRKEVFAPVASWPGTLGPGHAPEDWMYPAPTINVYLRDDIGGR
ncbi:MAG TPA: glycosyltransferase family 39 protein [Armatimonadota bacterium]|nr:glycosyltransferase family 39 protein [Armatimonadota bacterium]